jgi:hypothetical protein
MLVFAAMAAVRHKANQNTDTQKNQIKAITRYASDEGRAFVFSRGRTAAFTMRLAEIRRSGGLLPAGFGDLAQA